MAILSPSILAADPLNLGRDVLSAVSSGARWLHIDNMDGTFVPNISYGYSTVKAVRSITDAVLDVHLMIVQPEKFIKEVKDLGTMMMNVHYETCTHLHRVIQQIKDAGMKAGVTLNPATPVSLLADIIHEVDMVLLMSVNPGFGGQKFIPHTLDKIKELNPKYVFIVSNQGGIESGFINEDHFVDKCQYVCDIIKEYCKIENVWFTYCATNDKTAEDRKPNTAMLEYMLEMHSDNGYWFNTNNELKSTYNYYQGILKSIDKRDVQLFLSIINNKNNDKKLKKD